MGTTVKFPSRPEPATLEALYLEHEPRVRWIMYARGVPEALVDDLVHESFVAIHRRWPQRDLSVPLATWVVGVARNVAFSYRRAEARRHRVLHLVPPPIPGSPPDETVAACQAWREVEAFTRSLSPKLREVFVLADVSGEAVSDIAAATGLPVATLHSRLRLARRSFARHFAERRDPEERRELLHRAAAERASTTDARQRSLTGLLAATNFAVGTPTKVLAAANAITSTSTKVIAASLVAMAMGTGALAAWIDTPTAEVTERSSHRSAEGRVGRLLFEDVGLAAKAEARTPPQPVEAERRPSSTRSSSSPMARSRVEPISGATPPIRVPSSSDGATASPSPSTAVTADPLALHVAALERARTLVLAGRYDTALTVLDGVESPADGLHRDHQRVRLHAACGARRVQDARAAAAALASESVSSIDPDPCSNTRKVPTQ